MSLAGRATEQESRPRPRRHHLGGVLALSLLLAVVVWWVQGQRNPSELVDDEKSYHDIAVGLLHHQGYSDSYRPPGYAAFVYLAYGAFGVRPSAVFLLQALLLVVQIWLTYRIALLVLEARGPSLLTAGLCAIWPPFYMAVPVLYSELFFAVLLGLSLWSLYKAMDTKETRHSAAWGLATGVLLGFSALTKAVLLPYLAVAGILLFLARRSRVRPLVPALGLALGVALTLVPWTVRNDRVLGEFVPINTGGGFNLWQGNWPGLYHEPWVWNDFPPPLDSLVAGQSAVERDRILQDAALGYMREDPLRAAGIFARKFGLLWLSGLGVDPAMYGPHPMLRIGSFGIPKPAFGSVPLFAAALYGWFRMSARARKRSVPLALLLVHWTIVYVAIISLPRQAIPVTFFEILFASAGLWDLSARLRARLGEGPLRGGRNA